MMLSNDVPLIISVNSVPSGGRTMRNAWGRMIQRKAVAGVMASARAASD
jgi:hypothetical protein